MEESHNFGHEHPLVLLNEEQISNGSEGVNCSRCGEKVSAPSFSCVECGFYLHKNVLRHLWKLITLFIATIHLFFCKTHPILQIAISVTKHVRGSFIIALVNTTFISYMLYLPIILLEKKFKELEHLSHEDPLISTENDIAEDLRKCFGCWEPLANYTYFALDCGINLHKRCSELPLKMNPLWDREHSLVLQFNHEQHFCKICNKETHIECVSVSQLPVVEDKSHQHPFTLFWRQVPFICDACGTEGNYYAYICCTCSILVHKECISLHASSKAGGMMIITFFMGISFRKILKVRIA
ncbi:hypothetical protein CRYUN_Cryun29cG0019300 [Craigia yunnanensis]